MKKFLLLGAVAIFAVMAGNAQLKHVEKVRNINVPTPELIKQAPSKKAEVAQINEFRKSVHALQAPKAAPKANVRAWYNRPAGAYPFTAVVVGDDYAGSFSTPFIQMKPYAPYTWVNASEGADSYVWTVEQWTGTAYDTYEDNSVDLVTEYGLEFPDAPKLVAQGSGAENEYFYYSYDTSAEKPEKIQAASFSGPNATAITSWATNGYRVFNMSHPAIIADASEQYTYTYYRGATPHGNNQYGWWFGKNDSGLDGVCQIFEKPSHPYALKTVALDPATFTISMNENATLTANVYKLLVDQPQYVDDGETAVYLQQEDLELLSSTTIELDTTAADRSWFLFPIMEKEGDLEYESSLHVDFPILVEITGYNGEHSITDDGELLTADNGMLDFSACVTTNENPDGFGEMAFIKRYKYFDRDEDGNPYLLDEPYYVYEGLNNFFSSGEMKTGFSILIEVDMPFIVYYYNAEDGEYEFPVEGGSFNKTYTSETSSLTVDKLSLFSWESSDVWTIMTPEGDDIPDWLTIEPEDTYEEEEFTGLVELDVQAEPLPEGVSGRECTVVFTYPGAECTYHFIQGNPSELLKGDVNRDGKVNVTDVTTLVNMILEVIEKDMESADVNGDGKINVSDVTALVNIILGITE